MSVSFKLYEFLRDFDCYGGHQDAGRMIQPNSKTRKQNVHKYFCNDNFLPLIMRKNRVYNTDRVLFQLESDKNLQNIASAFNAKNTNTSHNVPVFPCMPR